MATQGIISITKEKKVIFKCITGMDGQMAEKAVNKIKKIPLENLTVYTLYNLCRSVDFGHKESLVIQSEKENYFEGDEELSPLYHNKEKFNDPKFNPRWEYGTADHIKVIEY